MPFSSIYWNIDKFLWELWKIKIRCDVVILINLVTCSKSAEYKTENAFTQWYLYERIIKSITFLQIFCDVHRLAKR